MQTDLGFHTQMCWLESSHGDLMPWDLNAADVTKGRLGGITLHYVQFNHFPGTGGYLIGQKVLGEEDSFAGIPDDIIEYSATQHGSFTWVSVVRLADVQSVEPFDAETRVDIWRQQLFISGSALKRHIQDTQPGLKSSPFAVSSQVLGKEHYGSLQFLTDPPGDRPPSPAIVSTGGIFFADGEAAAEIVEGDPDYYHGSALQSYQLVGHRNPNNSLSGHLGAVFQEAGQGAQLDLQYVSSTRHAGPLVQDGFSERNVSVGTTADGSILAAYYKAPVSRQPMVVEVDGEFMELLSIEEEDFGTFSMTRHLVAADLMAGTPQVRGGVIEPGQVVLVSAQIINTGDYAVSDSTGGRYSLFAIAADGRGSIPIVQNAAINGTLMGNSTAEVEVEWTIPEGGPFELVLVVDPNNDVEEFDETNNMTEEPVTVSAPTGIVEWLIGRLNLPDGLDANEDTVLDAGDLFPATP